MNLLSGLGHSEFKKSRRKVVLFGFEHLCLLQFIMLFFFEPTKCIPLFYFSLLCQLLQKSKWASILSKWPALLNLSVSNQKELILVPKTLEVTCEWVLYLGSLFLVSHSLSSPSTYGLMLTILQTEAGMVPSCRSIPKDTGR